VKKSLITAVTSATAAVVAVSFAPISSVFGGTGGGCTVAVPEPSTMAIVAAGVVGVLYLHRRKRRK
jgi:hypothetical protein